VHLPSIRIAAERAGTERGSSGQGCSRGQRSAKGASIDSPSCACAICGRVQGKRRGSCRLKRQLDWIGKAGNLGKWYNPAKNESPNKPQEAPCPPLNPFCMKL